MTVDLPVLGLFGINMGPCAATGGAVRIGALAEELGYESLWAGEHVVLPAPRAAGSPMEADEPILDPVTTLALLAGVTRTVRLGTGVIVLPQRNPLVLAKELASLDVLSGGRLVLGIGVGYLEPELRAVGVPMAGRGARTDEYLAAMRSLWEDDAPGYQGSYVSFGGVDAHPRPVQRPVPLVVGGHGEAAYRRTVRDGAGWYGFHLDRAATKQHVDGLRRAAVAAGRDPAAVPVTVSPVERLAAGVVGDYAELGVSRLVVVPPVFRRVGSPLSELEDFVLANAPAAVGARQQGVADS